MCSIVYAVQAGFKGWAMSQDGPLPRTGRLPSLPTTSLTVQVQFWRGLTHLLVRIGLRGYITLNRLCDSKCQHAIMQSVSQVVPRYTYVARLPPRSAPFGCNEAARNLKSEQVKLSREHVAGVYSAFFATLFRRIDEKVKTLTSPKGSPRSVPGRPLVVRERPRIKTSTANAERYRNENLKVTRTSGPRYPPQFDRMKISQGGVSLLGGSQIKNPEEEEPPCKLLKSINFGGCSSGGWFFLRVLGLETTQQIHSPGGGGFLQSNTHNQF